MTLLTGSSLGSFAVPYEDVADRLSVTITIMLTAVAFKFQIGSDTPNVSTSTQMDKFVLAAFTFIFLITILNIVAPSFFTEEEDLHCMYALASLFGASIIGIGIWVITSMARGRKVVQEFDKENKKQEDKCKKEAKQETKPAYRWPEALKLEGKYDNHGKRLIVDESLQ